VNNAELVKIIRAEFPQYEFKESKDGKNHIKLTSNEGWSISLGSQHRGDKFGSDLHLALIRNDVRRFHESHIRRLEERASSSSPSSESGGGGAEGVPSKAKEAAAYARYLLRQSQSPQNPVVGVFLERTAVNTNKEVEAQSDEEIRHEKEERRKALKLRLEDELIAAAATAARVARAAKEATAAKALVTRAAKEATAAKDREAVKKVKVSSLGQSATVVAASGLLLSLLIGIVKNNEKAAGNFNLTNSTVPQFLPQPNPVKIVVTSFLPSLVPSVTKQPNPVKIVTSSTKAKVEADEDAEKEAEAEETLSLDSRSVQYIIDTNKILYDFFVEEHMDKIGNDLKINKTYIPKLNTANFNSLLRLYHASNALIRELKIYLAGVGRGPNSPVFDVLDDYIDAKNIVIKEINSRNSFFAIPRNKVKTNFFSTFNKFHSLPKRRSKIFNSGR